MRIVTLIFSIFLLSGCKASKSQDVDYHETCFYWYRDYVVLNIYNFENKDIYIPNFLLAIDKDFNLNKNHYSIANDTLHVRTITADDIVVADAINPNIVIVKDSVEIKRGKKKQKIFKVKGYFKTIVLNDDNINFIFENCVAPQ